MLEAVATVLGGDGGERGRHDRGGGGGGGGLDGDTKT
jgi:hypothetical protein